MLVPLQVDSHFFKVIREFLIADPHSEETHMCIFLHVLGTAKHLTRRRQIHTLTAFLRDAIFAEHLRKDSDVLLVTAVI